MAKKKIIEDYESGKSVPTQELADAYMEEPKQSEPEEGKLVVYAPFEFRGKQYKVGDVFDPTNLNRDTSFDDFRQIKKRRGETLGIAFYEILPPRMKGDDPEVKRHILPLKEA